VLVGVGDACTRYCDVTRLGQLPSGNQSSLSTQLTAADGVATITYQERMETVHVESSFI